MGEQLVLNEGRTDPDLAGEELGPTASSIESRANEARSIGLATSPLPDPILAELSLDPTTELFHSPDGCNYATIPLDGRRETWPLDSKGFLQLLASQLYSSLGKMPSETFLRTRIGILKGQAQFRGPCKPVHVRLAEQDGSIFLDLADDHWRVIRIDADGWRLVDDSPVKFRRPRGMLPLPIPIEGGSLDELRPFVNLIGDNDWRVLVGWLVQAVRPLGPYPILCLHGQQGSAKSTTARLLRNLIDLNVAPLRTAPRDERDLAIAAGNAWMLIFDNLSSLHFWLSDALCRLATGGGFSTRQLYSNGEEAIFNAQRPCIVTGIEELATRGDLLERCLLLHLPAVPERHRRTEQEFWAEFERARPRILGGLLGVISGAMEQLPHTRPGTLPRLADFAAWVGAAEPALGWEEGSFQAAYKANRESANDMALEASPLVPPICQLLSGSPAWSGNASELLTELTRRADRSASRDRNWPKQPNTLSGRLRRLAPNLAEIGIEVTFANDGKRTIHLERR
jgi:hypothetical protein